jgi:hypothetical protein
MKANIRKNKIDHSVEHRSSSKAGRRVVLLALLPLLFGVLTGLLVLSRGQYGSSPEKGTTNPEQAVESFALEIPANSRNTIQFQSRENGKPLPDCTVRYLLQGSGSFHEAVTDQEGKVSLPTAGRYLLDISAEGYVGVRGVYTIAPQGGIFPLSRSGSLEIRFVDEQGYPVENADALLLPPVAAGPEWGDQWQREFDWNELETYDFLFEELLAGEIFPSGQPSDLKKRQMKRLFSDDPGMDSSGKRTISSKIRAASRRMHWRKVAADSGRILWTELSAGDGYRWGLLSEQNLAVTPEHEDQGKEYIPVRNGWKSGKKPPTGLSGMFSIRAGETTRLTIRIYGVTSVRGELVPGMGTFPETAVVRLYHRRQMTHQGVSPLTLVEQQAVVRTDSKGLFFFGSVNPGRKELTATWMDQAQNIYLYKTTFHLSPGESMDLGLIDPIKGESLQGVVNFQTDQGRVISTNELFGRTYYLKATLAIHNQTKDTPDHLGLMEFLRIEMEKPFIIHGLQTKKWFLEVGQNYHWPTIKPHYRIQEEYPEIEVDLSNSDLLSLSVRVESEGRWK